MALIWEQPDHVRIAAAQQRLTKLLDLCPAGKERQRAHRDESIDRIRRAIAVTEDRRAA